MLGYYYVMLLLLLCYVMLLLLLGYCYYVMLLLLLGYCYCYVMLCYVHLPPLPYRGMITLTKKLKSSKGTVTDETPKKRISIRDQLLVKEVCVWVWVCLCVCVLGAQELPNYCNYCIILLNV